MGKVGINETGSDIRIVLNGDSGVLLIRDAPKGSALLGPERIGLRGPSGSIELKGDAGSNTINLNGDTADVALGGAGQDGSVFVRNGTGKNTIVLDGKAGDITLANGAGDTAIFLKGSGADIELGGKSQDGRVVVRNAAGKNTIILDGKEGDIVLANADCAEDFDISEQQDVAPGTVMVLDREGRLQQSDQAYDKKVAGVISGAGQCRPGLVLDRRHLRDHRRPVALMGKTYCKVDAKYSSIDVGDLLTTSATPGHAMKASDPVKAFGAVIGKALRPLKDGQGLIPILVALQ